MKIDIKNLEFINETLRTICTEVEKETGVELTVTSLFRIGDTGVHGQLPLRGIDFRVKDILVGRLIEKKINQKWIYDTYRHKMKCALLHDVGQGLHLHVQAHANTIRVDKH